LIEGIDIFRIGLRWLHALAGVAWVGGSIFYLLALNPAVERVTSARVPAELMSAIGAEFRGLIKVAIPVFIFSGVILTFDRFSQGAITTQYVMVLSLKIALALWMFWLAVRMGERRMGPARAGRASESGLFGLRVSYPILVLVLGLAVYLLAIVLKIMYETALRLGSSL